MTHVFKKDMTQINSEILHDLPGSSKTYAFVELKQKIERTVNISLNVSFLSIVQRHSATQ